MDRITFRLAPRPPFRLDLTVWVLRRRPGNRIDQWDGTYRRVLARGGMVAEITVRQTGGKEAPSLLVTLAGREAGAIREEAARCITEMLGLETDLTGFYALAAGDSRFAGLVERFRGVKPPRFPTLFEGLANAVACQQVTLTLGIQLLNRLAATYGHPFGAGEDAPRSFPGPEDIAPLEPEALRALGFSRRKGEIIIGLARAILAGRLSPQSLAGLDDEAALGLLTSQRGIGRWSAEYLLLRTLGRIHIFPADDVGGRKNLERWLGLPHPLDYDSTRQTLAPWHPYAGLVYFHLLLDRLATAGHIS